MRSELTKQFLPARCALYLLPVAMLAFLRPAFAQSIPQPAIDQFNSVIGDRVELATILGGDYGAGGGIYSFRGGSVADLAVGKIGGGGNIASPRPLGDTGIRWAPVLLGNLGTIAAANQFNSGFLQGNNSEYDVYAVQGGGGARFYFNEHLSLAPTISGIYGHTKNDFQPHNAVGDFIKTAGAGNYVDWDIDTWTIAPSADLRYEWLWGRTAFELSSRYNYFHTESFYSSSSVIDINGDSHTLVTKIDVDLPLGVSLFNHELHTGGFFSSTRLFGGAARGLDSDHFYTANARFVMDFLGKVWKLRWLGIGASYFFGNHFDGWSAGVDVQFQF
jgi:hypothetical protein